MRRSSRLDGLAKLARGIAIIPALLALGASQPTSPPRLPQIDFVRVHKSERSIELFANGKQVHVITGIQLGGAPVGAKRFEGDQRTPEGLYEIDWANPASSYYLSLHISYPNAVDVAFAASHGRSAGGMIMIHGQPNGLLEGRVAGDWTDGCIAVSNDEMDALWEAVPDGTPIELLP